MTRNLDVGQRFQPVPSYPGVFQCPPRQLFRSGIVGRVSRCSLLALALCLPSVAPAHDSPEHVIEALTARIDSVGKRPDLLWRRATEHRALGQLDAAARDLRDALAAKPDHIPALQDLARIELAQGKTRQALRTINRAFKVTKDEAGLAPLRMVRADVWCARGSFDRALTDCDEALRHAGTVEMDWYLTRAQIQRRLGRLDDAVAGLRQAFEQTGSAVLEAEWIAALKRQRARR